MTTPELVAAIAEAPAQDVPALLTAVAARLAAVGGSMAAMPNSTNGQQPDEPLSAKEAAHRLGVSLPYLYKHAAEYPFAARRGRKRVFSAQGLAQWSRQQMNGRGA